MDDYLSPKKKKKRISLRTSKLIRKVHLAQAGINLDYDDFSPKDLRDIEYIFLRLKQGEKQESFEVLFKGLGDLVKKVMKAFKK